MSNETTFYDFTFDRNDPEAKPTLQVGAYDPMLFLVFQDKGEVEDFVRDAQDFLDGLPEPIDLSAATAEVTVEVRATYAIELRNLDEILGQEYFNGGEYEMKDVLEDQVFFTENVEDALRRSTGLDVEADRWDIYDYSVDDVITG